jgi:TolB-like protein/DNA-binding winged helix-turn-helix (wHTH) protein
MSAEIRRFGDFELDPNVCELRRDGRVVHLERIPFELLNLLTERSGQIVTREEILERVWGKGVFVETDSSINTAVRKLRRALDDDPDAPRFVITIPTKGYRFAGVIVIPNGQLTVNDALTQGGISTGKLEKNKAEDVHQEALPAAKNWGVELLSLAGLMVVVALIVFRQHLSLRTPQIHPSIQDIGQPALPLPDIPSIAVLAFTNLSGDPGQEYFSDGLTDLIITRLSKVPGLFVIARTSSFVYKGKPVSVQQVGRQLGVRTILEGSILRAGQRVRINAQLVNAANGTNLWTQSFDQPLKDIFALQDDIVRQIVTTLGLIFKLNTQHFTEIQIQQTDNLEAFDLHLRALASFWKLTKDDNELSRQFNQKAVALDPSYAEGYAGVGWNYALDVTYGWSLDPPGDIRRAAGFAQKALAHNDSTVMPLVLLGYTETLKGRFDDAVRDLENAVAADPNNSFGHWLLAEALCHDGKPDDAIPAIQMAIRLDPALQDWYGAILGRAYLQRRRYQEALSPLSRHTAAYPNDLYGHLDLAVAYIELGRDQDARAEAAEAIHLNPHFKMVPPELWTKDLAWGRRDNADLRKAGLK